MFVNIMACLCLVLVKITTREAVPAIAVLETGVLPIEKGTVALQFYVDIENKHHWSSCNVYSRPKMCCLYEGPYEDCYTEAVFGDNIESVTPQRMETLIHVFPTMYQYDLSGYCSFNIDYTCGIKKRSSQLQIKIPFNTTLVDKKAANYLKTYGNRKARKCKSVDLDALNDCAPVKCDLKYNGRRPFFNTMKNRCARAPDCITDLSKEFPDIVYVPDSNTCRDLEETLALNEIYAISSGLGVVIEPRRAVYNKNQVTIECSTISQNLLLLKDLMTGKLCPLFQGDTKAYADCTKNAILSICACIVATCVLLISIICCMHTTVWLLRKITKGDLRYYCGVIKRKFYKREYEHMRVSEQPSRLCRDVTNHLLKEVIVRDLPIELRESVVDLCDRIGREVSQKRRYRVSHLGSRVDLANGDSESTSACSMQGDR